MFKIPGPIVLAVALFLLALGAAGLAFYFPSLADITGIASMDPKGNPSQKVKADEIAASVASWNSPVIWTEPANHRRLFDSDEYLFYPSLYPNGNYIQKNDGTARSPGGVLLSWYKNSSIDFTEPGVDREDPDGDGFSNIVEFKNEQVGERVNAKDCDGSKSTDPLDAKSHPSYLSRLRLQQYESSPFHIKFNGYQQLDGKYEFQIFLTDLSSDQQPRLLHQGDTVAGGYVVGEFKLNIVTQFNKAINANEQVDKSTLELIKPDIDLHIVVPFRETIDSPESTADFVMLMPTETDKVIKVARGKILTVPYISATDAQYIVIDATDKGATIRDTKTKQDYHILKLINSEWDEVPLQVPSKSP